jgi:transposase
VKRWKDALLKEGPEGLKPKPHMGRPSRLSGRQRQDLLRVLNKGPQAAKLKSAKWTCAHVGIVIRRLFGVRYHPDHISRILRSIGWRFKKIPPPNNKRSRSFNQPRQWGGS